eukprot:scaffold29649_cov42-Phaeocystis_antarctica.AAC.2
MAKGGEIGGEIGGSGGGPVEHSPGLSRSLPGEDGLSRGSAGPAETVRRALRRRGSRPRALPGGAL